MNEELSSGPPPPKRLRLSRARRNVHDTSTSSSGHVGSWHLHHSCLEGQSLEATEVFHLRKDKRPVEEDLKNRSLHVKAGSTSWESDLKGPLFSSSSLQEPFHENDLSLIVLSDSEPSDVDLVPSKTCPPACVSGGEIDQCASADSKVNSLQELDDPESVGGLEKRQQKKLDENITYDNSREGDSVLCGPQPNYLCAETADSLNHRSAGLKTSVTQRVEGNTICVANGAGYTFSLVNDIHAGPSSVPVDDANECLEFSQRRISENQRHQTVVDSFGSVFESGRLSTEAEPPAEDSRYLGNVEEQVHLIPETVSEEQICPGLPVQSALVEAEPPEQGQVSGEVHASQRSMSPTRDPTDGSEASDVEPHHAADDLISEVRHQTVSSQTHGGASDEVQIAEDVAGDALTDVNTLPLTNHVHNPNSHEDHVTAGPSHTPTSLLTEETAPPNLNPITASGSAQPVDRSEEDVSTEDVIGILARTGRIVRAIGAYSLSPDLRTSESEPLQSASQTIPQLRFNQSHEIIDLTGDGVERSKQVTTEDVANIYAQAGAIAQAAKNWLSLSDAAKARAVGNINVNANWGSLVQENLPYDKYRFERRVSNSHTHMCGNGNPPAPQSEEPTGPDGLSCPICMEPWTNTGDHRICALACGHLFGKSCIKRWIKQSGRRLSKCPQCNKRAKLEELRNIYVPHIAVLDGQSHEMAQEVKRLKSDNHELKLRNSELQVDMARLQLELDRLRQTQVAASGAGILQKVEHNRDEPARRQAQSSLQTFFVRNDRRRSRRRSDVNLADGGSTKPLNTTIGHRSSSSLASIGSRGLGEKFILQDELYLTGAKVFDMEEHSQTALISNKASNQANVFGLTKISLHTLSEVQHVRLSPSSGAIRDVRLSPLSFGAPGKMALVASLGKKLSVFSSESNSVVQDYSLQSAPWSCAWDYDAPNQIYAGLQNGSVLFFDLRQTASPVASFPGSTNRPVHTIHAVQFQRRKGLLSASNSGAYFWDLGTSGSFSEINRPRCISDYHRDRLCVSLAFAPRIRAAVASFRPSPLSLTDSASAAPGVSQADECGGSLSRSSEPSSSIPPFAGTQDSPSHCIFTSHFEGASSADGNDDVDGVGPEWRWEAGRAMMVGHKSLSVMPRTSIIVEPPAGEDGPRTSFACGDEGTNAVWLWDMRSMNVTQMLVPHQSPVLDVKLVDSGDRILIGCISERTFQLYRRPFLS